MDQYSNTDRTVIFTGRVIGNGIWNQSQLRRACARSIYHVRTGGAIAMLIVLRENNNTRINAVSWQQGLLNQL